MVSEVTVTVAARRGEASGSGGCDPSQCWDAKKQFSMRPVDRYGAQNMLYNWIMNSITGCANGFQ
eukprot:4249837-Karenia_brevis.AAC.1